jgi:bifunctional NMN adenylyltransferase/nudix hydrolase
MTNFKEKTYDVGVIIGRFQVPELHDAHKYLIDRVIAKHKRVIILIGVTSTLGTKSNPLDFPSRVGLFKEYLTKFETRIILHPLTDVPGNDEVWSKQLDRIVRSVIPLGTVSLYGGRDSFIRHYSGGFDTYELGFESDSEGKKMRKECSQVLIDSRDFRAGQIYQSQNQFPKVFPTVDIAVVRQGDIGLEVLMGLKPNHNGFSFPGGFADPTDENYQETARRELSEEVDVEIDLFLRCVGSYRIADPRYTGEERIITTLFLADYVFGSGAPKSEFIETEWFKLDPSNLGFVADNHKQLFLDIVQFCRDFNIKRKTKSKEGRV